MSAKQPLSTPRYEQLLREQLRPSEVLDGIFEVGSSVSAAITSERLLTVGPAQPNGWEMKSIPWRLMTALTVDAAENELSQVRTMHLQYAVPRRAGGRRAPVLPGVQWVVSAAAATASPEPLVELTFTLEADGPLMATLLNARIPSVSPS